MPALVFPTSSAPGNAPQEGAGRLVNCYAVKTEQGARGPIKWQRAAGLREMVSGITQHSHCRGLIEIAGTVLAAMTNRVYTITEASEVFTATNAGALTGSDNVTLARNNAATPNILANTDDGLFNLFADGSAPTSFADGDMPSLTSICGVNGYLVGTTGAGYLWSTDLNSVSVQSDANTQAQTNPHGLLRGVYFRGEFFAGGPDGWAVYDEVGTTPFPLSYKQVFIPVGLVGTHAVTGFEPRGPGVLCWVAPDDTVRKLDGYQPTTISNEAVSRAIKSAADKSSIEAYCYSDGQNAFAGFTSPDEWTWEVNINTGAWDERSSYERDDWRGRKSVFAFDRWLVGDDLTGKLAKVDSTYKREYTEPLIATLRSGVNGGFPVEGGLEFDLTAALGNAAGEDPIETDPVAMIRYSCDGGYSWSNQLTKPLGKQGRGDKRVTQNRIGMIKSKGLVVELSISDPVAFEFYGAGTPRRVRAAA